jgi:GDP-L-fucose synthase
MTIVVAGHTGLVGSAIYELLKSRGEIIVGVNSSVVNLLDRKRTFEFIQDTKPQQIIASLSISFLKTYKFRTT